MTAGARVLQRVALLLAGLLGLAVALPARAQPVVVTAGEHADFTRVVLQSRAAFEARVIEVGAEVRIEGIDRAIQLDPARLFQRIPRIRLSDLRLDGDVLVLTRPCACPVRTLVVGPGVLAIDLRDGPPILPEPAAPALPPVEPPVQLVGAPMADPVRGAGLALAQRLSAGEEAAEPASPVAAPIAADQLVSDLSAHLAAAQSRGIVRPMVPAPEPRVLGPPVGLPALADLGPHLRLRDPDAAVAPQSEADRRETACPDPGAFAFLAPDPAPDFSGRLSELRAGAFGEFDQPDPAVATALVQHYLLWGLGAEARGVLDSAGVDIPDAELLGGFADVLEGHASNRRAALAAHQGCPGPAGLLARLAAPGEVPEAADAAALVAVYQELPGALRASLGPDLVRHLLAAGAIDAARMGLEALQRAAPDQIETLGLLAAEIERARGALEAASAQLTGLRTDGLEAQRLRLELDLQRGTPWEVDVLETTIALAEGMRSVEAGRILAELAIRHHALARRPAQGLALLDRFALWLDPTPGAAARIEALRLNLWTVAVDLPDREFLGLVLGRDDWRSALNAPALRAEIDARLAGLGLERLVAGDTAEPPSALPELPVGTAPPAPAPGEGLVPAVPAPAPGAGASWPETDPLAEMQALLALQQLAGADGQVAASAEMQVAGEPGTAVPSEARQETAPAAGPGTPPPGAQPAASEPGQAPLPQPSPPAPGADAAADDPLVDALRTLAASRSLRSELQALGLADP